VDHQQVLVDELVWQQGADQLAAAHDHEVAGHTLLERGDGTGNVAVQESRVGPVESRGGASRGNVLLGAVERVLVWAALGVPGAQHLLVTAPAKQQPTVGPTHPLAECLGHVLVVAGDRPSAVAEATTGVLVGSTGGLHDTVEGYVVDDDHSHE
jgi:hypothetical protein